MSATSEAPAAFRHSAARPGPLALIREGIDEILSRRRLVRYLVQADLRKKGADTLLGNLWWVLDPLLQMVVYVVFVAIILQASTPDYPLFILSAILPWKWFTASINDATTSVVSQERLIKQIQFPKIVLPVAATTAGVVGFGFGLIALGVIMLFFLHRISINLLFIPVIAAVQYVFTLGMALAVASVNVFFRDLGNVLRHLLRLWFYLSPALYSLSRARGHHVHAGEPGPARHRQGKPVRDPVRVVPRRHLRNARGWAGAAELGRAGGAAGGEHRPGRPDDDPLQAARAVVREGPLMAANAPTLVPGTRHAIEVADLGVRYSLRFSRKTTLRQSIAQVVSRQQVEEFWALRNVSFTLIQGESLGVIGPNGAGKSTLLQVLAGIITPSEGAVDVRGHVSSLLTLGAGFDQELTGSENILLAGAFLGLDDKVVRELLPDIVTYADLGQFIDAPIKTYSSGMRARLGFAIATSVDPDILLLDEVLATGDADFRAKSKQRVIELVKAAKGIVLVTHDMNWVTEYCNRALLLERGNVDRRGRAGGGRPRPRGALGAAQGRETGAAGIRGGRGGTARALGSGRVARRSPRSAPPRAPRPHRGPRPASARSAASRPSGSSARARIAAAIPSASPGS